MGRHTYVPPSSEQTAFTSVSSLLDSAVPVDPEATQPKIVLTAEQPKPVRVGRRFSWFRSNGSTLRRADRFDLCLLGIIIAQPALSDPTHFMTWVVTGVMLVLWVATLVRE